MRIFDAHTICVYTICMFDVIEIKKRPMNLTIREDVIAEAKALNLNASQAAENGMKAAIKKAKEDAWLAENRDAIQAHNDRIERNGLLVKSWWMRDKS